jgi:hypothetical protein
MGSINRYLPFDSEWQMDSGERLAVIALLEHLRPRLSLEVGSKHGGSLAVLSRYSQRVVSLDIDPEVPARLSRFPNVEFVIGDSRRTLPETLGRVAAGGEALSFALVDGDHTEEGVRADCAALIAQKPTTTLFVMMHDSFNPDVRRGILAAGWEASPWVQALELDAVPGSMKGAPLSRELWGGFAIAVLSPEPRAGKLSVEAGSDIGYRTLHAASAHRLLVRRVLQIGSLLRGKGLR